MSGYSQINGGQVWYELAKAEVNSDARSLFFFLLAPATERPTAGLRRFLPSEPLSFMPDWSLETAQEALRALERADLVRYDPKAALIFVPFLLVMQPCKGPNAVNGAASAIENYPDSPVLAGALEHLAQAAREAAANARERADGDAKKKESAERSAEQMEDLARSLTARLSRVGQGELPLQPPAKGLASPSLGDAKGLQRGSETPSKGLGPAAENKTGSPSEAPSEAPPKGVPRGLRSPFEGASRVTRARARPDPEPEPEEKESPRKPPPRGGPPSRLGSVLGRLGMGKGKDPGGNP
ncbi:MAG: hypothetical protein C4525_03055 [Desulfarculus sp.]|nr:MAG: hypothetical protein C4525_03055 [Desulfarculus sp.]